MSDETDEIRTILDSDCFDELDTFVEITEEENFTTEYDEMTLTGAISDFRRISELLNTTIDENVLDILSSEQRENIENKLSNVQTHAQRISNRNGRRNPGKGFINTVDDLEGYLFANLGLDLRLDEYYDVTQQLTELRKIREEQEETIQTLERANKTYEKIEKLHEDIVAGRNEIDDILSFATDAKEELENTRNDLSDTVENVNSDAQTINNEYEEVLKKTEQISDYEERMDDNLSKLETRSERIDKQQDDIDSLSDQISDLLSGAIAASLDRNFSKQKEELESSAQFWARATMGAIVVLIAFAFLVFQDITRVGEFGMRTLSRVTLLIPALIGVWFTSKNYSHKRRLMEEYAFKATIAQTLEPSRDVLESQLSADGSDEKLSEFMIVSMGQIFTNPSDIVENGSAADDDATNIETVKELSQDIIGRN